VRRCFIPLTLLVSHTMKRRKSGGASCLQLSSKRLSPYNPHGCFNVLRKTFFFESQKRSECVRLTIKSSFNQTYFCFWCTDPIVICLLWVSSILQPITLSCNDFNMDCLIACFPGQHKISHSIFSPFLMITF